MVVRPLARALLAAPFVYDGIDVARHPAPHVAAARPTLDLATGLARRPALSDRDATRLVRAHGALTTLAGLTLAVGRAPRSSSLVLAALTLPLAVVHQPFSRARHDAPEEGTPAGAGTPDRLRSFLRTLGLVGATLLGSVDTQGRPSVGWRVRRARDEHRAQHQD